MALGEISYDLAVSSGRIPNTDATEDTCCKLPGTEFLSSRFWRKTEGRYSTPRLSLGSISSPNAMQNATVKDSSSEMFSNDNKRFQRRIGGLFVNPLEDVQSDLRGHSGQRWHKVSKSIIQDAERTQSNNASGLEGISSTACAAPRNQKSR